MKKKHLIKIENIFKNSRKFFVIFYFSIISDSISEMKLIYSLRDVNGT